MKTKEHKIELDFIEELTKLKYIYRTDIKGRSSLEQNFRQKFEELNKVTLTDNEFNRLLEDITTPDIFKNSKLLREKQSFEREDGTPLYYTLVNIKDWCKNSFEVINQLKIDTQNSYHRYDVIILINGLPLVQVELKTLEVSPKRAMEQIANYKNDIGNGYTNSLLCFMQLFIVSNKSNTYYFANNDNRHFNFNQEERFLPIYQYAKPDNSKITYLDDFAKSFLSKCRLGETISSYMVLVQSEQKILIMRPYQIYAVEAIVECIKENRGNGYIWHTTGSGKTLTSFKASTLLKNNTDIQKILFVVDRKDLDRQTRQEFNKFQDGCVEENTNTSALVQRLLSDDYSDKVIVTTIQKLGIALDGTNKNNYKEQLEPLKNKRVVFIFDECHRSQFGENHKSIKEFFPLSQLFGFTGTPIKIENATYKTIEGEVATLKTTKDIFDKELHSYTITNAIDDGNVLRFHVDFFKPDIKPKDGIIPKRAVVKAILDKHLQATNGRKFNAIFATASINEAIEFYKIFKEEKHDLNITAIFSPPANGDSDIKQLQEDLPQEQLDNKTEPNRKKEALINIIDDYNKNFGTNHSINNFDNYYQDIQTRIKSQKFSNSDLAQKEKLDIVIVVDMLLTGFDSHYLNTLYVDKNLKYHALIQAFSRTNRVLNATKPYGNILDFRSQQKEVDEAIALFSGTSTKTPKEIWLVEPAPAIIEKLDNATKELEQFLHSQGLEATPSDVANLKGDNARVEFIKKFKEVQKLKTNLEQYTDLDEEQKQIIENIMPKDTTRAYKGVYLDIASKLKTRQPNDDENKSIEQLDFEFVLFASAVIDYDYIMNLISQYSSTKPQQKKITKEQLIDILKSNSNLLDEKDDMIEYINSLRVGVALNELDIKDGYEKFKKTKNDNELLNIANKHNIELKSLKEFVDLIISRLIFDGELLTDLLAPLGLGWKDRRIKELALMEDLIPHLKKLANGKDISGLEAYDE